MSTVISPTVDAQMGKLYNSSQKHNLRMRSVREPAPITKRSVKRKTLQVMVRPLKRWLCKNKNHPYPNKMEKIQLCSETEMTVTQVSNWFANARRRLKSTVTSVVPNDWASRINRYNDYIVGKQEMLSDEDDFARPGTNGEHAAFDYNQSETSDDMSVDNEVCADNNVDGDNEEIDDDDGHDNDAHDDDDHDNDVRDDEAVTSCPPEDPGLDCSRLQTPSYSTSHPVNQTIRELMMCRYLNDQHASVISTMNSSDCSRRQRHTSGSTGEVSYSISDSDDSKDEFYWKEITAAMALTDMSRMKSIL